MSIVCEVVKDLVPLHLDGTASKMSESLIRRHLKRCEDCREYYAICSESRDAEVKRMIENAENAEDEENRFDAPENGYALIAKRMEKSILIERLVYVAAFVSAVAATFIFCNVGKNKKNK